MPKPFRTGRKVMWLHHLLLNMRRCVHMHIRSGGSRITTRGCDRSDTSRNMNIPKDDTDKKRKKTETSQRPLSTALSQFRPLFGILSCCNIICTICIWAAWWPTTIPLSTKSDSKQYYLLQSILSLNNQIKYTGLNE